MAEVTLDGVHKVFPNGFCALERLTLEVRDGEFLVLVGPSGCGKSTVLNLIAGLEPCTGGEISIGGRVVTDEPSKRRDVAMVFQDYALYPHMSVARNIGFPLELAKLPKSEIAARVQEAAAILGLEAQLDKKPGQLSGGQKQRVAMGRAIVRRPSVFLMDEPLSNLDAKLRVQMRSEIAKLQYDLGVTTIYVTHDQVEAMTMGDRVAVMLDGELQQLDTPQAMYAAPANMFVAGFIGSPPMNLLRGRFERIVDRETVHVGTGSVTLETPSGATFESGDVVVGIRPEHLRLAGVGDATLRGVVTVVESLGAELLVHVDVDAAPARISERVTDERAREELDGAPVSHAGEHSRPTATLIARADPATPIAKGENVGVAFDPRRVHLFDAESGRAVGAG